MTTEMADLGCSEIIYCGWQQDIGEVVIVAVVVGCVVLCCVVL